METKSVGGGQHGVKGEAGGFREIRFWFAIEILAWHAAFVNTDFNLKC